MHVSRCRFWWCSKCQAVFEKEDLQTKIGLYGGSADVTVLGTRTCGHCGSTYQVKDIYAGRHDVPRQFWGQLQQPVELPGGEGERQAPGSGARRRRQQPKGSALSVLTAWLLFLVSVGSGLAILGYVLVKPLLAG
jgi:hypothetical protein